MGEYIISKLEGNDHWGENVELIVTIDGRELVRMSHTSPELSFSIEPGKLFRIKAEEVGLSLSFGSVSFEPSLLPKDRSFWLPMFTKPEDRVFGLPTKALSAVWLQITPSSSQLKSVPEVTEPSESEPEDTLPVQEYESEIKKLKDINEANALMFRARERAIHEELDAQIKSLTLECEKYKQLYHQLETEHLQCAKDKEILNTEKELYLKQWEDSQQDNKKILKESKELEQRFEKLVKENEEVKTELVQVSIALKAANTSLELHKKITDQANRDRKELEICREEIRKFRNMDKSNSPAQGERKSPDFQRKDVRNIVNNDKMSSLEDHNRLTLLVPQQKSMSITDVKSKSPINTDRKPAIVKNRNSASPIKTERKNMISRVDVDKMVQIKLREMGRGEMYNKISSNVYLIGKSRITVEAVDGKIMSRVGNKLVPFEEIVRDKIKTPHKRRVTADSLSVNAKPTVNYMKTPSRLGTDSFKSITPVRTKSSTNFSKNNISPSK